MIQAVVNDALDTTYPSSRYLVLDLRTSEWKAKQYFAEWNSKVPTICFSGTDVMFSLKVYLLVLLDCELFDGRGHFSGFITLFAPNTRKIHLLNEDIVLEK